MNVRRIICTSQLEQIPAASWNALAGGIPFRGRDWLTTWWAHYGGDCELYTLVFEEDGSLTGLTPFYLRRSLGQGRLLRLLGDGEVCSDYLGLIGANDRTQELIQATADWLCSHSKDPAHGWDALHLEGVAAHDAVLAALVDELAARGCRVHRHETANCWRIELPATWQAYEALLSKSHRKQVRRLIDRVLDRGRAKLHTANDSVELEQGRRILIDLHQRRRRGLGEPGSFSSPRFAAFHEQVMRRLLAAGQLRLQWLELDGMPAAAEYQLAHDGVIYGYQSGVAPELLAEEPGRLSAIASLRLAVEQGFHAYDFLRGDEPYKAHFRAEPRRLLTYRIASPRTTARVRHHAWTLRRQVKDWLRPRNEATTKTASDPLEQRYGSPQTLTTDH